MEVAARLETVAVRRTLVVRVATTRQELPRVWGALLGEVWDCLRDSHAAVLARCAGRGLRPTRVRWEVYGLHRDDPAEQEVEVGWYVTR